MTESNVKMIRFIDRHPITSITIIFSLVILSVVLLAIGLSNIGQENHKKISDRFETMTCEQLIQVPYSNGLWMENNNDFYQKWADEMKRCSK